MDGLGTAWVNKVKEGGFWTSSVYDPDGIEYEGLVLTMLGTGRRLTGCGRQLNGCGRQLNGCGRQLSGSGRQLSGSGRQLSGSGRQLSGSGRRLSDSWTSLAVSVPPFYERCRGNYDVDSEFDQEARWFPSRTCWYRDAR